LEYLNIIKRRIWIVIGLTLVAAALSGLLSIFVIDPIYEAKTSLIVTRVSKENDKMRYDEILMYQTLVKTYSELAKSRAVAKDAISKLKINITPDELIENLRVSPKPDTQIIEIAVQDKDPKKAYNLANILSEVFIEKVQTIMNSDDVKIMDMAEMPRMPIKPKVFLNIMLAGFTVFLVSVGIIFLIDYMDNTIKTEKDVERYIKVPVLSTIPYTKSKVFDLESPVSENYRSLRTGIKFATFEKDIKTIVVTSVGPSEGKSTITQNLGTLMAASGSRVLLMEGDLRNPTVHKNFSIDNNTGLTNILTTDASYRLYIKESGVDNLDIIPSGPKPPNPAELLGSLRMKYLIDNLRYEYDYIFIDTPPAFIVTDASILSSFCDGTILAIASGKTNIESAVKTKDTLLKVNANIIGAVLNKVKGENIKKYYNYYTKSSKI
jgi:capsular exopolysaccharide synthesis family protein